MEKKDLQADHSANTELIKIERIVEQVIQDPAVQMVMKDPGVTPEKEIIEEVAQRVAGNLLAQRDNGIQIAQEGKSDSNTKALDGDHTAGTQVGEKSVNAETGDLTEKIGDNVQPVNSKNGDLIKPITEHGQPIDIKTDDLIESIEEDQSTNEINDGSDELPEGESKSENENDEDPAGNAKDKKHSASAEGDDAVEKSEESNRPESNASTNNQSTQTKTMTAAERHLKVIQQQTEEAKDPATYETYDFQISGADEKIKLFTARRRGVLHVQRDIPCQDYCLATSVNGYTVLADADGVSSCERSDVGSRLACEAVVQAVKMAAGSCANEEQFVNRIMTAVFRERLLSVWIKSVMKEIKNIVADSKADQLSEFSKYGSTLMYAVMTENWIVVGNLGDGQVMVFNDSFGVKLREHAPKDSSRVRCLANEKCAREDFQVAKYPRKYFNGVLLSTDGIYESLDKNMHYYHYAMQMKHRFTERDPMEPYQAFCYKEAGEPFKDFSVMRTMDDCSIALAIDDTRIDTDYGKIFDSVDSHSSAMLFRRWDVNCMSFLTEADGVYADVNVAEKPAENSIKELKTAVVDQPIETWREGDRYFSKYAYIDAPTIEFLHCSGGLRRDRHNPEASEKKILDIFTRLRNLQKELDELGYELNSSAVFNVLFDGNTLIVRPDAILKKDASDGSGIKTIDRLFIHMLGTVSSEEASMPVFDIGYLDRGVISSTVIFEAKEKLYQIVREKGGLKMKNVSPFLWRLGDESTVLPNETIDLKASFDFTVLDQLGEKQKKFKYTTRESL